MNRIHVQGHTNSWNAHANTPQCGENECVENGNSQQLWKDGDARINTVSGICLGFEMIIEIVSISTDFETPNSNQRIADNANNTDYSDTG